jgi:hypothetical protein
VCYWVQECIEIAKLLFTNCTAHNTPHYVTPHHITPHHTTPNHTTSNHTTPHHTTLHHTTPHHTAPHHITPNHTTPNHTTSNHGSQKMQHILSLMLATNTVTLYDAALERELSEKKRRDTEVAAMSGLTILTAGVCVCVCVCASMTSPQLHHTTLYFTTLHCTNFITHHTTLHLQPSLSRCTQEIAGATVCTQQCQ